MTPSNMKEGAYSFLKQYPTSAVERILVHLSVSCGIMSLQFNLTASKKALEFTWTKVTKKKS